MALTIWGRTTSSNVQKLLWGCAEMSVAYDRPDMAGAFGFTDEYLAMNPNRLVPTIDDDGFILWESNACLRYLSEKHGRGTLWPEDPHVRADADRWMDWQLATLGPGFTGMFHGLVRDKPENRNLDAINKSIATTQANLEILDGYLADSAFIAGDELTMGDIPIGIYAYRWYAFDDIERKPLPNLERWYAALQERPAFREFVMVGLG